MTFSPPLTVVQVLLAVSGLPVAGFAVLPFALLADVIDVDAKSSGARREAIYFGVQAIFQKSMMGLSVVAFATSHASFGAELAMDGGRRWWHMCDGIGDLLFLSAQETIVGEILLWTGVRSESGL